VQPLRSATRRRLDRQLVGLDRRVGAPPPKGWIRTIREAVRMSTYDLARRMRISQSQASKLEHSEVDGSIRLVTLNRAARALGCRLVYVLVPEQPLEHIVRRQARRKALESLRASLAGQPDLQEQALLDEVLSDYVDALAYEFIDRVGLWQD
jgi:predicted DNA-binding mobile mystery protein A